MTPAERADAVMDAFYASPDLIHGPQTVLLTLITKAIGEAERDAVRAAAEKVDRLSQKPWPFEVKSALRTAMREVQRSSSNGGGR